MPGLRPRARNLLLPAGIRLSHEIRRNRIQPGDRPVDGPHRRRSRTDPRDTELYLGGQGTAAKILFERVPPDVDPFSPDNLLIFSTGLLNGTLAPSANRTVVNTFSPQTNLMSHSLFGGFFGPELKFAGYDRIIIKGKAPDLVYLYIHNDQVEIRDATHLRGKGTTETQDLLKKELKDQRFQVAAIGLAGENRVYMASIDHNHASASRGVGVIMGDKRLKAIAVRGTRDLNVARPAELFELSQALHQKIGEGDGNGDWMAVDEDDSFHHNHFAWGNARTRRKDFWSDELQERWTQWKLDHMDRQTGCFNCAKKCRNVINWPGRPRFGYKCFGKDTYHMAAFLELDFTYEILGVAQEYGLDSYSTPQVIAFALELLEAGILTDKDFPDMPADSRGRFFYLLEKIVRREGIGDILADSVSHAAKRIGNGAEAFDHNTTKKFEQLPIKLGKLNPAYFLMIATGEKMSITQIEGSFPQDPLPTREQREAFVSKWEAVPDEKFKKYFLEWEKRDDISDAGHLRDRGLERSDALHRRRHRAVRLRVVVPRPVRRRRRLPHEQHSRRCFRTPPAWRSTRSGCGRRSSESAPWCGPSTCEEACAARTNARPRTTGRCATRPTNRSCWAATTHSRAGTTRAFRPARRWSGSTSAMRPTTWSEGGS